jgi:hypothetical protein
MSNLTKRFNYKFYILFNKDLQNLNEEEAIFHYNTHGIYENRKCNILPDDFDYLNYLELNPDLDRSDEESVISHYENYGYFENRQYKINHINNINNVSVINNDINILQFFLQWYNISFEEFNKNLKIQFRFECFKNINFIKNISLPPILENSNLEAVLIEFRCFPHLEFIIRNNIIKLGSKWSHTVICGNLNYDYMFKLCENISTKIKVIKTNFDNLIPSEYSRFLTTFDFWNLLKGKKILIYQEDSLIFKNNIDDFLYFDYIGAPWTNDKNDNKSCVGNGGFSLRTKEIMIKVLNTLSIDKTQFNTNTLEYMKNTNSFFPPEDVYFTKTMEDFNIGILSDWNSAMKFSTESVNYTDSLGGHNFWYSDPNWLDRIYKFNIVSFKPHYDLSILEHRGGWTHVLKKLEECHFFNQNSNFHFFDIIEKEFLWRKDYYCDNKWGGVLHCTPNTPPYLKEIDLEEMFKNENFIKSLYNCVFIVSLSDSLTKYLMKKIKCELKLNLPIYTLFHPVVSDNIPLFEMQKFIINENKILIQIGQQLRKMTSIYLLNSLNCSKLWLTGTKNMEKVKDLLEKEINFLNIDRNLLNNNISMYYTETFEEYDQLLSHNLVFVDLFDAAANNTILECIVRNTPIIINKINPVVEYLGDDYPLYFNQLDDVKYLINTQKIEEAHNYLKNMDKTKFTLNYFVNKLFDIINEHFLKYY